MSAELVPAEDRPNVAALEPAQRGALVAPAGSVAEIAAAFEDYQRVCLELLSDDDFQSISGKKFRKRSAWRKLAVAFGVTFEISDRVIEREGRHVFYAEFVIRATAPNGRYVDGWGACDALERCCSPGCGKKHGHCPGAEGEDCPGWTHFSHANHDIPATAETRAKNRAAADLFGMGEVSAEEITGLDRQREHDELKDELETLMDTAESLGLEVDREKVREHGAQSVDHARQAMRILRGRMDAQTEDAETPAPTDPPEGQPAPSDEEVDRAPESVKPAVDDAAPEGEGSPAGADPAGESAASCEGTRHVGPMDRIGIARTRCRSCGATGGPDGPGTPEPKADGGAPAAEPAPNEPSWRTVAEDMGVPPVAVVAALVKEWPKNDQAARPNNLKDVDRLTAKPEYRDLVRATIEDIAAERASV